MQDTIFLALPSYDGKMMVDTATRLPDNEVLPVKIAPYAGSLLPVTFNILWASALNAYDKGLVTHFAMLHADIIPDNKWLERLLLLMKQHKCDIISAVVPLKDQTGITSTGIGHPTDPWQVVKRLTLYEVHNRLPITFDASHCNYKDYPLLLNTGCMLIDLSKPWCDGFEFNIYSRITKHNGERFVEARSEDWELSRHVHAAGGKLAATSAVGLYHAGTMHYGNQHAWGNCQADPNTIAIC